MFRSRKNVMSRREERELLKLGREVFADDFPNPERVGCPPERDLKAIAFRHKQTASDEGLSDHLSVCSPCFREYTRYRQQARRQSYIRSALMAAALVILAVSATFIWRRSGPLSQPHPEMAQLRSVPVMLDLRRLSAARSEHPTPESNAQVTIPAKQLQLTVQLPVGSEEGQYDVAIFNSAGEQVARASGTAALLRHVMTLQVNLDLRGVSAGRYVLGTRRTGSSWSWYEAEIR